jgi:hypothetical protein
MRQPSIGRLVGNVANQPLDRRERVAFVSIIGRDRAIAGGKL